MKNFIKKFDVIVVGGGAAGMMAAIHASGLGANVLIVEKNKQLGVKLGITGGGRCNITHDTKVVRELLSQYGEAGKFLFSTFMQFDVTKTKLWFDSIGVKTVTEAEERVFPVSQKAPFVVEKLIEKLNKSGVVVNTNTEITSILKQKNIFEVTTAKNDKFQARKLILATGGVSHPETGSTGDGFLWLKKIGHTIEESKTMLVPLIVKDQNRIKFLSGVSLEKVGISIWSGPDRHYKDTGKVLFTHDGLSGPGILKSSRTVSDLLSYNKPSTVRLDFFPDLAVDVLEGQLLNRLIDFPNRLLKNQWSDWLPQSLVIFLLEESGIGTEIFSHSVTVSMRRNLVKFLKACPFEVKKLHGMNRAIVSSGGVALTEIDFRTMESKIISGLYIVGDLLNIDRPSGGYSLQLCWTTGAVSGSCAANNRMLL